MIEEQIARGPFREFNVLGHRCTIEFIRAEMADKKFNRENDQLVFWIGFSPNVGSVISTGVVLPIKDYDRTKLLSALHMAIEDKIRRLEKEAEIKAAREEVQDTKRGALNGIVTWVSNLLAPEK